MSTKKTETQTGPTPATDSQAGGAFGHNPLAGRAHIVNRGDLQDEANAGPGSLDPKTLAQSKVPEVRRWLAKRGIELEIPANWKYLGLANDGRTITFVSDTHAAAHAIELHLWGMPEDLTGEKFIATQREQLEEAMTLKRVLAWNPKKLGQVDGLLVVGWGPDTRDALSQTSDEDLYLATDGTGRRAISWRGVVERPAGDGGKERQLVILALSSPIETFPDAKAVYDALLDRVGVWA